MYQKIIIHSDGGSRGNPGHAGIGYVITADQETIQQTGEYIGQTTNNVAEYKAILTALSTLLKKEIIADEISCFLDSELVVRQLGGQYKIKNANLQVLAAEVIQTIAKLKNKGVKSIRFTSILRQENKIADSLVNQAIDKATLQNPKINKNEALF